ncbi:MAG: Sporulation transcription regulator WhiA [Firmicutes bacterium]|nr:Sporulation transcription regulator WhiA [Bacillota bacterium]MDI6704852.1 DNA-binding protein WhiA [Bacillota bacterium]
MSFSSIAKNELSRIIPDNYCCQMAELSAIVRMGGIIRLRGSENISLRMVTENAAIARKIFILLKKLYGLNIEIMVRKNRHLKKNHSYIMEVTAAMGADRVLMDTGVALKDTEGMYRINYKVPGFVLEERCCRRSYLRGAFLGGGSVSDPERAYHLEFVTHSSDHAEDLKRLINGFSLSSKIVERKSNYVVYIKEGEQIVDLLNIVGAHNALLKFENTRIFKQMRNDVNRIVNCETANLTKTVNASIRQIETIEYIKNTVGLDKLPSNLREIAELRLNYRDASLKELGQMLSPALGKSGINHRFRKIEEIAEQIKASRGK